MDQLKEFLKQAVKYRFWIAVGLSALLPMIAYFVASGSLQGETTKQEADITGSQKGVSAYTGGAVVNKDYKPLVEEKTAALTKDVNASWRELYGRQAPLLTWPSEVEKNFKDWGRKFPEKIDPSLIRDTIDAYMRVYAQQVTGVYKSFHPWDPEAGEGIVVAPPEVALLQPATFDPSKPPLPGLGRIWSAQEKLWIQGTVLDVIRQVNDKAKAKDWETAVVKQIEALIVASPLAQDQRSAAKGDALEPAKEIVDPNAPVVEKPAADSGGGGSARFARGADGGIGGGAAATKGEDVYYLASPNPDQYQIVPIYLSVLIDQASIPDLLVEFQNSPMGIQVMDMEMKRPDERVRKPVKGVAPAFGGGMAGNMSMGGGRGMRLGGGGGRGMADGGEAGYPNMSGGSSAYNGAGGGRGGRGPMDGMGGGGATRTPTKTGEKNVENANRTNAKGEPAAKKDDAPPPISKFSDPYFNVVELRIYGQARFYQPPPPEEPGSETSASAAPATPAAEPAKADEAAKKDEPAKAEDVPKKDDAAKKDEPAKVDAPKPDEAAKKDEPKPEAPKADAPPAEAPKAEPPKADAPKR